MMMTIKMLEMVPRDLWILKDVTWSVSNRLWTKAFNFGACEIIPPPY